jgi:hypothetical protein
MTIRLLELIRKSSVPLNLEINHHFSLMNPKTPVQIEKSEEIMPNKTTAVEPAGRFNCQKLGQWLYSTRANLQSLVLSVLGLLYKTQAPIHSPHVT